MKKNHRVIVGFAVIFLAAMFTFSACEDGGETTTTTTRVAATAITVAPLQANVGDEVTLTAALTPEDATDKDKITWTIKSALVDKTLVTLDEIKTGTTNTFKSTKPQTVIITVAVPDDNVSKDVTITVKGTDIPASNPPKGLTTTGTPGSEVNLPAELNDGAKINGWEVTDAGGTGVTSVTWDAETGKFKLDPKPATAGKIKLTAFTDASQGDYEINIETGGGSSFTITPPGARVDLFLEFSSAAPTGGYTGSFYFKTPAGYTNFQWYLDGNLQSGEERTTYTVPVTSLLKGSHSVTVVAKKTADGKTYSATETFKVNL